MPSFTCMMVQRWQRKHYVFFWPYCSLDKWLSYYHSIIISVPMFGSLNRHLPVRIPLGWAYTLVWYKQWSVSWSSQHQQVLIKLTPRHTVSSSVWQGIHHLWYKLKHIFVQYSFICNFGLSSMVARKKLNFLTCKQHITFLGVQYLYLKVPSVQNRNTATVK